MVCTIPLQSSSFSYGQVKPPHRLVERDDVEARVLHLSTELRNFGVMSPIRLGANALCSSASGNTRCSMKITPTPRV